MNDPQNNRSQSDATQTPIDTVSLNSSPSSQSTSQDDRLPMQRGDAIAHGFGLGGRRRTDNSTVSDEEDRRTLRRSR